MTSAVITIVQGQDVDLDATVYTDETLTTKKDLSGGSVVGRIGSSSTPETDLESAGSVLDGPEGEIRVPFTAAQTATLEAGLHDVQIEAIDNSGNKGYPIDQKLRVKPVLPDLP